MSVMRILERPETVETKHGIKKATHEVFCYSIKPFVIPPITVSIYKGTLDAKGHFQILVESQTTVDVGQEGFRQLLHPTPQGKPAGDFRLSDVLHLLQDDGKEKS